MLENDYYLNPLIYMMWVLQFLCDTTELLPNTIITKAIYFLYCLLIQQINGDSKLEKAVNV